MKLLTIACAAAAGLASAASAQEPTSTTERRLLASQFADCVLEEQSARAENYVLDRREAGESLRQNREVIAVDCIPVDDEGAVRISIGPSPIRYALAEALIRKEPSLRLADPASVAPLDHGVAGGAGLERKRMNILISQFGECVVRAAAAPSYALLETEIGSSAEAAAFEGLKPAVSACLPAGHTVDFPPETLRGTIALNYYRLAKASRLVAGAQTQ